MSYSTSRSTSSCADVVKRTLALLLFAACSTVSTPQLWIDQLAESGEAIKRSEHERAHAISESVVRDMAVQLGSGDEESAIFSLALTHRALALAGLGRQDEALWYWHTVMALYPRFAKSDLSMFGEAGAFLARNRDWPRRPADAVYIAHDTPPPEGVTPPRLSLAAPRYPLAAQAYLAEGKIAVEFLITKEGVIKDPRVLEGHPHPALTYAALDVIKRSWRAKPAMKDGAPVDAIYYIDFLYQFRDRLDRWPF